MLFGYFATFYVLLSAVNVTGKVGNPKIRTVQWTVFNCSWNHNIDVHEKKKKNWEEKQNSTVASLIS